MGIGALEKIDIFATDHAPHTFEEKSIQIPAGIPLVQHSLQMLLGSILTIFF